MVIAVNTALWLLQKLNIHHTSIHPPITSVHPKQTGNTAESDRALPGVLMKTMKSCNWSCISQVRWWIGKGTEAIKGRGRYTPTGRCFQKMVLAFEWFDMFWCCYYIDQPYLEMLRWSMFIGCLRFPWKKLHIDMRIKYSHVVVFLPSESPWSHCGKIDHLGTNLIYSFYSHSLIFRGTRWLPSRNVGRSIKPSICIDRVDRMWWKWRSFKSSQSLSFTVGDPFLLTCRITIELFHWCSFVSSGSCILVCFRL